MVAGVMRPPSTAKQEVRPMGKSSKSSNPSKFTNRHPALGQLVDATKCGRWSLECGVRLLLASCLIGLRGSLEPRFQRGGRLGL